MIEYHMHLVHTTRQIDGETTFRGWIFLYRLTRWFRRVKDFIIQCFITEQLAELLIDVNGGVKVSHLAGQKCTA